MSYANVVFSLIKEKEKESTKKEISIKGKVSDPRFFCI